MKAIWRRASCTISVTVLVAAVPAPGSAADPATGDPLAVQIGLIQAADRIAAATAGTTGLAGISLDLEANRVRVHWKGDVPASLAGVVAGVVADVEVLPARYSAVELQAAGARILAAQGVTGVAAQPDGSAVLVLYSADERSARLLPEIAAAPVPVQISPYERPILAEGRQQDTSPYSGGSMYQFPINGGTGYCSTGFAVRVGSVDKMLSAGHCGHDGDTVYAGSGSGPAPVMGTVSGSSQAYDTLLIEADSAGTVYSGPHWSTTPSKKPIQAAFGNYPKTMVCTSGAMTGQHCDIMVTHTNLTIKVEADGGGWYPISGLVRAQRPMQGVSAGLGDSGGPVVAMDSGIAGFTFVYPLGTVSAIDQGSQVACGPAQFAWTICSSRIYYADLNLALARYSAIIVD